MADIKTVVVDFKAGFDLLLEDALLSEDYGFDTAIIISLFTDRRADATDKLPLGQTDRRGWWGDSYSKSDDGESDLIGSRLWLLDGKRTQANLVKAKEYADESLQWMVKDRIAKSAAAETSYIRENILLLVVKITKPNGEMIERRYEILWDNV